MKYILQSETPCVACKAPKKKKEFLLQREETDLNKITNYTRYTVNDCDKCGKYSGKLV